MDRCESMRHAAHLRVSPVYGTNQELSQFRLPKRRRPAPPDAGAVDRPVAADGCPVARAVLFAKVGDHIALLTIEPPKQRRQ